MSTIIVTNNTDSAVAGEIDLRQAVAEASAGDTIVFAPHEGDVTLNAPLVIAAGKDITIDGDPGATTGFGAQGLYANEGDSIAGQVVVAAGALLTLKNGYVLESYLTTPSQPAGASGEGGFSGHDGTTDGQSGTNGTGGGNGAAGADSAAVLGAIQNYGALDLVDENVSGFTYAGTGGSGGTGGDAGYGGAGQSNPNGNGGNGGDGGNGGAGGSGGDGGAAVGGIYNDGDLAIQNSIIYGSANGGQGGNGGEGGLGGQGGDGGPSLNGSGVGGNGGKGGNEGAIGASGDGGSAFGAIDNAGTLVLLGANNINGTATAGAGGVAGPDYSGGAGGFGGSPGGLNGKHGAAGAVGVNGKAGAAIAIIGGNAAIGQATTGGEFFFGESPTDYSVGVTSFALKADWYDFGASATATVDWQVVTGALGPKLSDFTTPASGALSYSNSYPGTISQAINLTVSPTASEPRDEIFTVELYDPSAGNVVAVGTQTITFVNSNAHVTAVSGAPYASYQDIDNAQGKLIGQEFFNSDGSLYLAETITPAANDETIYSFSNGSYFNAEPYSSYQQVYVSGVFTETDYLFTNVTGESYSSYEYDYSAGNAFIGSKFFYTSASAGANYTGYEYDYNGGGQVTRINFTGVAGQGYSSYAYDYVGGIFAGSEFTYTSAPNGATYSSYEVDYNAARAFAGEKFFYDDVQNASYTGEEIDYDASVKLSKVILTGVTGQPYTSIEDDYKAGVYSGYKAFETGITGQAYTSEEIDASASGALQKVIYSGMSKSYSSLEVDYAAGAATDEIYNVTNVPGASAYAYQVEENASGTVVLQTTYDLNAGGHAIIAGAAGQTLVSQGDDTMTGSTTGATSFVFHAIYGADTITNFTSADHVTLTGTEFASLSDMLSTNHAKAPNGNVVVTASDGDTLTFDGTTIAALAKLTSNFSFS